MPALLIGLAGHLPCSGLRFLKRLHCESRTAVENRPGGEWPAEKSAGSLGGPGGFCGELHGSNTPEASRDDRKSTALRPEKLVPDSREPDYGL